VSDKNKKMLEDLEVLAVKLENGEFDAELCSLKEHMESKGDGRDFNDQDRAELKDIVSRNLKYEIRPKIVLTKEDIAKYITILYDYDINVNLHKKEEFEIDYIKKMKAEALARINGFGTTQYTKIGEPRGMWQLLSQEQYTHASLSFKQVNWAERLEAGHESFKREEAWHRKIRPASNIDLALTDLYTSTKATKKHLQAFAVSLKTQLPELYQNFKGDLFALVKARTKFW
jgi:hypothetical protein